MSCGVRVRTCKYVCDCLHLENKTRTHARKGKQSLPLCPHSRARALTSESKDCSATPEGDVRTETDKTRRRWARKRALTSHIALRLVSVCVCVLGARACASACRPTLCLCVCSDRPRQQTPRHRLDHSQAGRQSAARQSDWREERQSELSE